MKADLEPTDTKEYYYYLNFCSLGSILLCLPLGEFTSYIEFFSQYKNLMLSFSIRGTCFHSSEIGFGRVGKEIEMFMQFFKDPIVRGQFVTGLCL